MNTRSKKLRKEPLQEEIHEREILKEKKKEIKDYEPIWDEEEVLYDVKAEQSSCPVIYKPDLYTFLKSTCPIVKNLKTYKVRKHLFDLRKKELIVLLKYTYPYYYKYSVDIDIFDLYSNFIPEQIPKGIKKIKFTLEE